MNGLKELIERELEKYLEWPTTDKSHVTTASAKLFAEHVATLHADHIHDAGKMAAPAVQGEPVGWQFYQHGEWWSGEHRIKDHRKNTEDAGFRVRDVYAAPQPAEEQPRSAALIVEQTEQIAALLAKAFHGSQLTEGVTFRDCESPKAKQCWDVACHIQEELTATDVENALAELEDDQQPACTAQSGKSDSQANLSADSERQAPDVSGLVRAMEDAAQSLETISTGAGRGEFMEDIPDIRGYARSRAMVARAALAAHRKQGGEA